MGDDARMLRLAFVDVETTGGGDHQVCEFGAVLCDVDEHWQFTERGSYTTLVRPDEPFSRFAIRIHGITPEKVRDQPRFPDIAAHVLKMLTGRVIVAHNANFDVGVLRKEFAKVGVELAASCAQSICTNNMAEQLDHLESRKLSRVAEHYGIPLVNAHRAIADAQACRDIFAAMLGDGAVPRPRPIKPIAPA